MTPRSMIATQPLRLSSLRTDFRPETMAAMETHGRIEMQCALPLPYAGDGSGQWGGNGRIGPGDLGSRVNAQNP
jgi:hypothetical protein